MRPLMLESTSPLCGTVANVKSKKEQSESPWGCNCNSQKSFKEFLPLEWRINFKNNTKIFQTSPIVFATQLAPQNGRLHLTM
jgi:hypothetical protein